MRFLGLFSINLSGKVGLQTAAITLAVLLSGYLFVSHLATQNALRHLEREAEVLGQSIQTSVQAMTGPQGVLPARANEISSKFKKIKGVRAVRFYGEDLERSAQSGSGEGGESLEKDFLRGIMISGVPVNVVDFPGGNVKRFVPLLSAAQGPVVGLVEVELSTQAALTAVSEFQGRLILVGIGLTGALTLLQMFFFRRIITQRILNLGRLAHRVSQGDLRARVAAGAADEIGQLGRILNLMTEKLERARTNLEKELEVQKEIDRLKDNFLAMVGHELRTPLTAVVGLSNAMLEGYAGEVNAQQVRLLNQIQEKGEHLSLIINNILDLEKIKNGQMKISLEEISLREIIAKSISMVENRAKQKKLELINEFSLDLPPMAMDRVKVQSVVTNLLDNAIKFTPEGGRIRLTARKVVSESDADFVELLISDNGIGIPLGEEAKIFDRFYQVQQGLNRHFGGAGLGLPLARAFAQSHGGWLDLKRRPGWSTTFSFGLPLKLEKTFSVLDIRKSPCYIPSMLNGIVRMLEEERGERLGVEVTWPLDKDIEEVEADKEYLRSILIIILQNVIRYRNEGTVVDVFVTSAGEELCITIENEGPPFSEEELKKIYETAGQELNGMKPKSPTFSLRTAVSIFQAHGGRLGIENVTADREGKPKTGVRFILRLPTRSRTLSIPGGDGHGQKKDINH